MNRRVLLAATIAFLIISVLFARGFNRKIIAGRLKAAAPVPFIALDSDLPSKQLGPDAVEMARFFGLDVSLPNPETGEIADGFTIEDYLRLKSYPYTIPVTATYKQIVFNYDLEPFSIVVMSTALIDNILKKEGIVDYKFYTVPELAFYETTPKVLMTSRDYSRVIRGTVRATANSKNKFGLEPGKSTTFDVEVSFLPDSDVLKAERFELLGFVESPSKVAELLGEYYKSREGSNPAEDNPLVVTMEEPQIVVPDDYPTIQEAITASKDGDTIMVRPGEYVENITINNKNIILRGQNPHDRQLVESIVINGNLEGSTVSITDSQATIAGFTILGGSGTLLDLDRIDRFTGFYTFGDCKRFYGGGIIIENSSPLIANNIIKDNNVFDEHRKNGMGGGIAALEGSSPLIINNIIENNRANKGGGIYVIDDHQELHYSSLTMFGSKETGFVIDNYRAETATENIELENFGSIIKSNAIHNNLADYGGGIHADRSTPQIIGNCIAHNKARGEGGGLSLGDDHSGIPLGLPFANLTKLFNNYIAENQAEKSGGAVAVYTGSFISLGYNTIIKNEAPQGALIYSGTINSPSLLALGITECTYFNMVKNTLGDNHSFNGKNIAGEAKPFFIISDNANFDL